jgi:DNA-directed RNA polymerase specialized sigma24 family protein
LERFSKTGGEPISAPQYFVDAVVGRCRPSTDLNARNRSTCAKNEWADGFFLPTLPVIAENQRIRAAVFSKSEELKAFMSENPNENEDSASEPEGSVARAIAKYLHGDNSELGELVSALNAELVAKAGNKLRNAPRLRSVTDAEGAVASAVGSYWRALANGKFRDMRHSGELKGLLIKFVDCKALHQMRKHSSLKAGGGRVINEPATGLDVGGREPSPLDAAIENENLTRIRAVVVEWRDRMSEKGLLEVAELHLEGQGYQQIAESLNIPKSRVRRSITMVNSLTRALAEEEIGE